MEAPNSSVLTIRCLQMFQTVSQVSLISKDGFFSLFLENHPIYVLNACIVKANIKTGFKTLNSFQYLLC